VPSELAGLLPDQELAGPRNIGQASGDVDGIADDHESRRLARPSDEHLAGVDTGMDSGKAWVLAVPESGPVPDQLETGPYCPLRVILVRSGHPEHRHEPIAHHLRNGATVVFDDEPHRGHPGPHGEVDVLRVEGGGHRRIPRQVGKQDRDELSLSLYSRLAAVRAEQRSGFEALAAGDTGSCRPRLRLTRLRLTRASRPGCHAVSRTAGARSLLARAVGLVAIVQHDRAVRPLHTGDGVDLLEEQALHFLE
jgi:hypothetical protein